MKKICVVLFAFALALYLGNVAGLSAYAQNDESDEDVFELEEVTVTATKRVEDLQAVPRSIAVVTADDLDLRSAASVMDVLESTAGVTFQGGFNGQLFVRGVGPAGSMMMDPGNEPSVQFNVDGNLSIYAPGQSVSPTFQALNDVDRIEIIRGPAGAMNGRMAASGTINVITTDPDFDRLNANANVQVGNYDTLNISAATNLPLKLTGLDLPSYIENLSFRVAARQDKHSEYIHNTDGEGVSGSQDFFTIRTKMKWQPIESLNLLTQYTVTRDKSNNSMTVPSIDQDQSWPRSSAHPDDPWLNATASAASEREAQEQYSLSFEATWETKLGLLTGRYSKSWVPMKCGAPGAGGPPPPSGGVCYEGDIYQNEYEVRVSSPDENRIQWMAGAYKYYKKEYAGPDAQFDAIDPDAVDINFSSFYGRGNFFSSLGYDINSPDFDANDPTRSWAIPELDPVDPDSIVFVKNSATRPIDSYSFFGNISIPLFEDKHRFALGLRKNMEGKKRQTVLGVFGFDDSYGGLPHFTFEPSENDPTSGTWYCDNCYLIYSQDPHIMEQNSDPVNYTIGWEYDWKPEVLLYANVNNGFKPGGVSPEAVPNTYYEPETLINYAVGTRSRWFDNKLQLNAEAFIMEYDNLQMSINSQSKICYDAADGSTYCQAYRWQSRVVNIGKTYVKGFELDYDWLITPRDRLKGNIELKEAEYGDLVYRLGDSGMPPGHPEYTDFKGRPMPQAPKFTFNTSYSHRFNIGNIALTPRFDVKYSSKYVTINQYWWEVVGAEVWQPAYWKYNAYLNVGWANGNWQFNAYCKNISETVVRDQAGQNVSIQDPRTVGAGLTVRF